MMASAQPRIRPADLGDIGFLAWVVLAASRSHVPRGFWDLWVDAGEDATLAFIANLLSSERPHWCHYSRFIIAECDGQPGAALSAYTVDDPELMSPGDAIETASLASGFSAAQQADAGGRIEAFFPCLPDDAPDSWIVEWVATAPLHRRKGLVQALLEKQFDIGRSRGQAVTQISILSGNDPAQRAYERSGYRYVDEKRSAAFEAITLSPGILRMLRPL